MTDIWRSKCGTVELRCGRWQDVLSDVARCDAVITDPPYGERTHKNQKYERKHGAEPGNVTSRGIGYGHISPADAEEAAHALSLLVRNWVCVFTSHDLVDSVESGMDKSGLYVFSPIPCVQVGMNCRLAGDGPSNWTCWLVPGRPRSNCKWGTLPGAYVGNPFDPGQNTATATRRVNIVGSKPLWLMRSIVRDYSRPGDLIVDPYAGSGTTLLAAAIEGRRAIGAECDPETFKKAVRRLEAGWTTRLTFPQRQKPKQVGLL